MISPRCTVFSTISVKLLIETYLAKKRSSTEASKNTPLPENAASSHSKLSSRPRPYASGPGPGSARSTGSEWMDWMPWTCLRVAGSAISAYSDNISRNAAAPFCSSELTSER